MVKSRTLIFLNALEIQWIALSITPVKQKSLRQRRRDPALPKLAQRQWHFCPNLPTNKTQSCNAEPVRLPCASA
jgi:hypothetical protein